MRRPIYNILYYVKMYNYIGLQRIRNTYGNNVSFDFYKSECKYNNNKKRHDIHFLSVYKHGNQNSILVFFCYI